MPLNLPKLLNRLSLIGLLAAPSMAQVSSPPGLLTTEGAASCPVFGGYPEARFMFLDDGFRGQPLTINEIAWRQDSDAGATAARGWSKVTVDYAPCDASRQYVEFSNVASSTPTRVFSGSMSWPALSGPPATRPAPWGGPGGQLRVPFSRPIVTTGTQDISFDFVMTGGTAAGFVEIQMDAADSVGRRFGAVEYFGNAVRNGCMDSRARGFASSLDASCVTHAVGYPDPSVSDTVEVAAFTYNTARNAPVAHVVGLAGTPAGVPWPGVTCNRLHVDLSMPVELMVPGANEFGIASSPFRVPFRPALVGLSVWMQAAWEDSASRQLLLTNGARVTVPPQPRRITRTALFSGEPAATRVALSSTGDLLNPVFRFGR